MQNLLSHIQKYTQKSWVQFFLFSGIIWLVFVHLHLNRHLEDLIIGPHYWRKSDTYAQIMNYYYNGLNFFDHGLYYNQMDSNGKAVAEFPLMYWLIALQLKLFGNHIIIIKINYIVLLISGLFSVFKISHYFLKNMGLSLAVAVLLFLSPIFSFYALAYLPDPLALNFVFIGLWFLLKFTTSKKGNTFLILAMLFLSIGGMIKPFFLIPYLAFLGVIILNQIIFKKKSTPFKWQYLMPIILVGIWFYYTAWYNAKVGSDYFLSEARPIWHYSQESILKTWTAIVNKWSGDYFNPLYLAILAILLCVNILWWQKNKILYQLYYVLSVLGVVSFVVLFYNMFEHHDYYVFPILFIAPFTLGFFIFKIKSALNHKIVSIAFTFTVLFTLFLGLNYSWVKNENRRKTPWINSNHLFKDYQNLEHFLQKNNVKQSDYVFAFSDKSPSFALSLMNRKGWSGFQTKPNKLELTELIDKGALYLIYNKNAPLILNDSVIFNNYLDYPIDDTNNIYLYDLKPYKN